MCVNNVDTFCKYTLELRTEQPYDIKVRNNENL